MGVQASNWHNLHHIWNTYKLKPLVYLLIQHKLSWLGHVARLLEIRYPHFALFAQLKGITYGHGRLPQTFKYIVCKDFKAVGIPFQGGEWYV